MSRLTILSVAEKPSVAKSLAEIIGRGQFTSRNGISPFNKVFEVEGDFRGQRCKMIITSVLGHMMNMEIDEAYSSWAGTNPLGLFDCKVYKTFNKAGEQLKATLEREIRNCDGLMLWLDCDLEGENIAFEVLNCCEKANPRIAGKVYRAKFSALNERDIFHTLNNPGIPNRHMNDAVDARQEIDLRLGAAFTRFQTLRLQSKFPQALNGHTLVSYGPCQFPTLGFVVDQYIKIQQFIPENFWRLTMEIETIDVDADPSGMKKKKKYPFEWERGRLYDHLSCFLIFEECCTADYAVVMECNSKPTTKMRPCPLNTVELQMEASRKLHITSDHTMDIAEKLYQAGHISYPRTETTVYKEGSNLIELITAQVNDGMWGGYAASLLDQQLFEWPRDGGQNDQAHPPIHPLKALTNSDPGSDEFKIYELITRHFLACCSRDAKGQQSTVKVEVSTAVQGELFKATGTKIIPLLCTLFLWLNTG
jgi:DNA topoisomerase-3